MITYQILDYYSADRQEKIHSQFIELIGTKLPTFQMMCVCVCALLRFANFAQQYESHVEIPFDMCNELIWHDIFFRSLSAINGEDWHFGQFISI